MRIWHLSVAALLVFGLGCNKSQQGGTPGTTASFKLSLPGPASQDVKQDDTRTLDASIDRGSDFKKDVKLKVESMDKKVDVSLTKETIKAGEDTKFGIKVKPEKDAPLADVDVKVTATPVDGGEAVSQTFKVKVVAK